MIRHEAVNTKADGILATVEEREFLGGEILYRLRLPSGDAVHLEQRKPVHWPVGHQVPIEVHIPNAVVFADAGSEPIELVSTSSGTRTIESRSVKLLPAPWHRHDRDWIASANTSPDILPFVGSLTTLETRPPRTVIWQLGAV